MAALQMIPLFVLGSTDDGGLGINQSAASIILITAPAALLLSLMLLDWLCSECVANILSRPMGQLLRIAVALEVSGLGILISLPFLSKLPAEVEGAALVAAISMVEGSLLVSFNHMEVWIPSLPDYLSACGAANWISSVGDAVGAFLGPLLYAIAVSQRSHALHPTVWLQLLCASSILMCLAV
jgi:hypothetical protein